MYKIALLFITIISFFVTPLTFASNNGSVSTTLYGYNDNDGEKFTFVEKGITFSIFRNGEFDFYIDRRNSINTNVDFGSVNISYNAGYNYEAYVQYDDYGAIIQIEGIPIYYDYYGRITRAGDVKINYHSNRVVRIGGMHVYYNTYGYYSYYSGFINPYNRYYAFHPYHNYFIRPYYNRCVVSYNPYRRHYRPYRYDYHYGNNNYNGHHYYKKGNFKRVDSRVSSRETQRVNHRASQKYTHDRRKSRNSNLASSQNLQRNLKSNNSRSSRSDAFVKKQNSKRDMTSLRNRTSNSEYKIGQKIKKEGSTTSQRRTVGSRNTPGKNVQHYKTAQRSRVDKIKPGPKRVSARNTTKRTTSRSENYKQSKVQNSIRKKNIHPRNKRTVANRSHAERPSL
jgi:hypothetical protein